MTRVNYIERQRLRAEDLRGEQDYLLGLSGRHYLGPHTWGVVSGLHVSLNGQEAVISPGLAIDGYGREIVVGEQVKLPLNDSKEQFVYLHYCERSEGGCGGNPNSRWRDAAEVFVTEERLPIPETDPDLSIARAAGQVSDYSPSPILLGAIYLLPDGGPVPKFALEPLDEDYRFVCLRAARILSPSGRALMRIGQENLADLYHFSVAVQDKEGLLQNRFAIDRDGNHQIWGNLFLQGIGYSALFIAPKQGLVLAVESPTTAGSELLWSVKQTVNNSGKLALEIQFRNKKSLQIIKGPVFRPESARSVNLALLHFNNRPFPLQIRKSGEVSPGFAESDNPPESAIDIPDDRELPMTRSGARLRFSPDKDAPSPVSSYCGDNDESEPTLPKGFVFGPTVSAPTVINSRDIYCIKAGTAEQPVEELRISCGLLAKGDFTTRFAIGGSKSKKPFERWLQVRGDGSVVLRGGGQKDKDGKVFTMINVTGTAEYPPIKPDPRDPLFNFLINLAFFNGILAVSSSLLKVTVKGPPFIETANLEWKYDLSVQNLGLTEPLIRISAEEDIVSDIQTKTNRQFATPERVEKTSTETREIKHNTKDLPAGNAIEIEVRVVMKAGSAKAAGRDRSQRIPIYESPEFSHDIPDSIPAGIAPQFELQIINGNSQKLTLTDIHVVGIPPTDVLEPTSRDLQPGQKTKTNKATIPAQPEGELTMTIKITYLWDGAKVPTTREIIKTVRITAGIQ